MEDEKYISDSEVSQDAIPTQAEIREKYLEEQRKKTPRQKVISRYAKMLKKKEKLPLLEE